MCYKFIIYSCNDMQRERETVSNILAQYIIRVRPDPSYSLSLSLSTISLTPQHTYMTQLCVAIDEEIFAWTH